MRWSIGEFVVPTVVVLVALSLVVPLPIFILDFLLTASFILAIILIVRAFTTTSILQLSSFPSLILLATLFRLALNISTSRAILSEGQVGKIIETLAIVMIGESLTIGIVVFMIITIIQMIVIIKGAERVAEVSARFTLDALPGRQMTIDSEARSGVITQQEAQKKREELQEESRFYGALDGSMKFIKGDAIAGMIITFVNLVGGICIATIFRNESIDIALVKYSIYTIGDGLVSQIPALLNAVASGIIVTRVAGNGKTLADDLFIQLFSSPGVQISIGIGCLILALIPGLPWLSLIIFSTLLIGISCLKLNQTSNPKLTEENLSVSLVVPPYEVKVSKESLVKDSDITDFIKGLEIGRKLIFENSGILLPKALVNQSNNSNVIEILIRGELVQKIKTDSSNNICIKELAHLVTKVIDQFKIELIDDQLTQSLLLQYESSMPELVAHITPDFFSITELTLLLKDLAREGVSIRALDQIIQSVVESIIKSGKGRGLIEEVRSRLSRSICNSLKDEDGRIPVVCLSNEFELRCIELERESGVLNLSETKQLRSFLETNKDHVRAVVVSRPARPLVRDYLRGLGFNLSCISSDEVRYGLAHLDVQAIFEPVAD